MNRCRCCSSLSGKVSQVFMSESQSLFTYICLAYGCCLVVGLFRGPSCWVRSRHDYHTTMVSGEIQGLSYIYVCMYIVACIRVYVRCLYVRMCAVTRCRRTGCKRMYVCTVHLSGAIPRNSRGPRRLLPGLWMYICTCKTFLFPLPFVRITVINRPTKSFTPRGYRCGFPHVEIKEYPVTTSHINILFARNVTVQG